MIESIRAAYWAEPFVPFDLILDDGRVVSVVDPFHLSINPSDKWIAVTTPQDELLMIQVPQIVRLETKETSVP